MNHAIFVFLLYRNQLLFNLFNFNRLPGSPTNEGNNAYIMFYVDYPSNIRNGTVSQAILASIVSANLQKLQDLTGFSITLDTSVTPPSPGVASAVQQTNAVELEIASFSQSQVNSMPMQIKAKTKTVEMTEYFFQACCKFKIAINCRHVLGMALLEFCNAPCVGYR